MISENTRFSFHCYSDPVGAANPESIAVFQNGIVVIGHPIVVAKEQPADPDARIAGGGVLALSLDQRAG